MHLRMAYYKGISPLHYVAVEMTKKEKEIIKVIAL